MPRASHRPGGVTRARSAVVRVRACPRVWARDTREGIALSGTPLLVCLKAARLPRCEPPVTSLNVLHSGSQVTRSYLGS
eukprot:7358635-Prymnesium_polylepis.1